MQDNPGAYLLKQCDKEAVQQREEKRYSQPSHNIKYPGVYSIWNNEVPYEYRIKELIRIIDMKESEQQYAF